MKKWIFFLSCLFLIQVLFAQTQLPTFFSDSMVLQQNTDAAFWGTDKPKSKIIITGSWGKTAQTVADSTGKWKLKLTTPMAGGPFEVVIKGTKIKTLKNVLIGEVWLCSGQSNMEMPVKGYNNQPIIGSNEAILQSANNKIRVYHTPRAVSITPLNDVKSNWKIADPYTTGNFSATAYFFARKINAVLGIPVGIIQTSWGASSVESWMDKETLSAFPNKIIPASKPDSMPQQIPTIMFNGMLHPYIGFTIKGMIWYQGESNRNNANEYQALFTAMINSWRKQWNQGDFSFYFVQIAPFEPGKINAAYLREAQLKTMLSVNNTGMVVTLDIGEKNIIHPAQKETVGSRLAYWALAKDYSLKGFAYSGPVYKSMQQLPNGRISLKFDYAGLGLNSFGKPLNNFEVAGADSIFYPAQAVIVNDKTGLVNVWSDSVPKAFHVRYAFKNWAEASLFNIEGLPASSFRTDNW
jgi:sialate O-acetylesterase